MPLFGAVRPHEHDGLAHHGEEPHPLRVGRVALERRRGGIGVGERHHVTACSKSGRATNFSPRLPERAVDRVLELDEIHQVLDVVELGRVDPHDG